MAEQSQTEFTNDKSPDNYEEKPLQTDDTMVIFINEIRGFKDNELIERYQFLMNEYKTSSRKETSEGFVQFVSMEDILDLERCLSALKDELIDRRLYRTSLG